MRKEQKKDMDDRRNTETDRDRRQTGEQWRRMNEEMGNG